jgi:hypothetical protein
MAGSSPARAPMMPVAARPLAQAWGGMTTASRWPGGVGGGSGCADGNSGGAAGQGQQGGLGQELGADLG